MNRHNDSSFIWTSFTDLMTSIFFISLVLFVVTYIKLQKMVKLEKNKYEKIQTTYTSLKNLSNSVYFEYNTRCKRFEMKQDIHFDGDSSFLYDKYYVDLEQAGKILEKFIRKQEELYNKTDFNFIVIIEGRAAKISEDPKINRKVSNFAKKLSYDRAKVISDFWESRGIQLRSKMTDVIIAGNGHDGLCRYAENGYEDEEEGKNKRFIIQVIPHLTYIYDENKK